MRLLIAGKLALPPSSVSCFRDVTLYSSMFSGYEVLIESRRAQRDTVWSWLKSHGAADYVSDFVRPGHVDGVSLSYKKSCNICVTRITANNLEFIINRLAQHARQNLEPDWTAGVDHLIEELTRNHNKQPPPFL